MCLEQNQCRPVGRVENSCKFSPDRKAQITISKTLQGIELYFSDNGIGIATSDIAKVFQSFYRSDSSNHTTIKGTGLGLFIVKRMTDLLQIKFKIESEISKGTKVLLVFDENLKTGLSLQKTNF